MSDEALTEVLGEKCTDCGWRRGQHRPPMDNPPAEACPRWTP